jgi:hypothetical protein
LAGFPPDNGGFNSLSVHFFSTYKGREDFVIQKKIFVVHCIKANFDKIMHVLREILGNEFPIDGNLLRPGPKPHFTDMEVLALSITAECMGIDSECYLFAKLEDYKLVFPRMISRRQYNDRRKALFTWQEYIRNKLACNLNDITEVYAIDSMPLEICKLSRMERNKMGKDCEQSAPNKGYCASQDKWFFGYKLHGVCSASGVLQSLDLSKASVHDVHYLKDVSQQFKDCIITGDRGYINKDLKEKLWKENRVCMEVPYRSNQKEKKPVLYVLKKIRKRIETVFSQLCDQFMIQRNYAKSFTGYKTRILAKVTGMTVLQFINKLNSRPIGQIKYAFQYK